jgi:hypothetical protein
LVRRPAPSMAVSLCDYHLILSPLFCDRIKGRT